MKIGILFLVAVTATACASTPPTGADDKTAQADDSSTGTVCTYERPTGSFMKEKRCTTATEREAARQQQGLIDTRNQRDSGTL